MPLVKSAKKEAISKNISEMVHSGYPRRQAVAAALDTARRYGKKKQEGGPVEEEQPAATLERTEEGLPFYQAQRQPVPHSALRFVESLRDRWNQPPPIKPAAQPPQPQPLQPRPDEQMGKAGKHLIQDYANYFDPWKRTPEGEPVEDVLARPEGAPPGKVPEIRSDYLAPVIGGLDIGSNLIGIPTAIAGGISKAALAFGLKSAISQAHTKIPALAAKELAQLTKESAFLDTSGFKQVGHQLGFMPGGVYTAPDGAAYYLKVGPSIEQVKNEHLASVLYRLAGTPAAEVNVTHIGGHPGIASKMLQNSYQLSEAKEPYNQIKGLHENFVVDAWLANHDAVGTGGENPLGNIMISNGQAVRIDGGGALRYKGSGDPKKHFNDEADEIFSMRDPNFSKRSAQVFGDISKEDLIKGAQKVADIDEYELAKAIAQYGPSGFEEQLALLTKLSKRRQYIMDQFGVTPKHAAKPVPEAPAEAEQVKKIVHKDPLGDYIEYQLPSGEKITSKTPIAAYEPPKAEPYRGDDPYQAIATDMPPEYWSKVEKDAARQDQMVGEKDFSEGYTPPVNALGDIDVGATRAAKPAVKDKTSFLTTDAASQMNPQLLNALFDLDVLDKKTAKSLAASIKGVFSSHTAANLWNIAEHTNPHKAEAIFRALSEADQEATGRAIAAIKKDFGYSPWDDMSGGKYLIAKSVSYKPGYFQKEALDKAKEMISGKPVAPSTMADKKKSMVYKSQEAAKAVPVLDPKADANKIYAESKGNMDKIASSIYDKAIFNPVHADNIVKNLPKHVQDEFQAYFDDVLAKRAYDPFKASMGKQEEIKKIIHALGKPIDWQSYKPIYQKGIKPIEWGPVSKAIIKSLGFGVEFPLFHGKSSIPSATALKYGMAKPSWSSKFHYDKDHYPIPEVERYPEELFDPVKGKPYEQAFFLADNPQIAKAYGPNVLPFLARPEKAFRVQWQDVNHGSDHYSGDVMSTVIQASRSQGADMIILERIDDPVGGYQTQYLILNPAILRGPKAKFDPTKLHLRYPLAGLAGASVVGGGTLAYGDLEEEKMNRGGFARGGMGSAPWNVRKGTHPSGLIKSTVPGRTDKIPMNLKSGSYVIPAETVSALGENNTLAGGEILNRMLKTGPYGTKLPTANKGRTRLPRISMPRGKKPPKLPTVPQPKFADGGEAHVPIIAAGGEYVVDPEVVTNIGNGNMDAGHRVLDKLVLGIRKRHIETLKKLKPPKQ